MRLPALPVLLFGLCLGSVLATSAARAAPTVLLEEMTSPEVRQAIAAGRKTIIVPVGGTEQNGAHMALGKHNARATAIATRIAIELGNAVVAPTLAYVPEGQVSPPTEHMRYAGTISIPDAAFKGLLQGAARSFAHHGFTDIVFIGEHGGYQSQLRAVAEGLNKEWAASGKARAHFVAEYYQAAQAPFTQLLLQKGVRQDQIGLHAGAADTALMMAVNPAYVKPALMPRDAREAASVGVSGDPKAATAELGQSGVDLIVARTVAAIRQATATRP